MPEVNDARYTQTTTTRIIDQPCKAIYMTILVPFDISLICWFLSTLVLVEHTATPQPLPAGRGFLYAARLFILPILRG